MAQDEVSSAPQAIPINSLPIQELQSLKQQMEDDIALLRSNQQKLRYAADSFKGCNDGLVNLSKQDEGAEVLIPLTSSVYVHGNICDKENVMVDIGTGYNLVKTNDAAQKYFDRRIAAVNQQITKTAKAIQEKKRVVYSINLAIQEKIIKMQTQNA